MLQRNACAYVLITILLAISGLIIYVISQYSAGISNVFPAVECTSLIDAYGDSLEEYAIQDFNYITAHVGK